MATKTKTANALEKGTVKARANGHSRDGAGEAQPILEQRGRITQRFGESIRLPIALNEKTRDASVKVLNQLLADTMALRDMYKKHHWQVSGHTFYQLHLLFDKHYEEQLELVDTIAERIQMLGGVSIAMAHDVAEMTRLERPPRDREEVPVQISRLLEGHKLILEFARETCEQTSDNGDWGTNDMIAGDVIRTNEMQVWFLSEHLVDTPLVRADEEEAEQTRAQAAGQ